MKEIRRARFKRLFGPDTPERRAWFMEKTGLSKGRVTQLLDDNEPFGDRVAMRLCDALGLPRGYFDHAYEQEVREDGVWHTTPETPPNSPLDAQPVFKHSDPDADVALAVTEMGMGMSDREVLAMLNLLDDQERLAWLDKLRRHVVFKLTGMGAHGEEHPAKNVGRTRSGGG